MGILINEAGQLARRCSAPNIAWIPELTIATEIELRVIGGRRILAVAELHLVVHRRLLIELLVFHGIRSVDIEKGFRVHLEHALLHPLISNIDEIIDG